MEQDTRHTPGGAPAGRRPPARRGRSPGGWGSRTPRPARRIPAPRRIPPPTPRGTPRGTCRAARRLRRRALDGPGVVVRPGHPRPRRGGEDGVQPDAAVQVHDPTRGAPAGAGSPPPSPAPGAGCSGRRRGGARAPSTPARRLAQPRVPRLHPLRHHGRAEHARAPPLPSARQRGSSGTPRHRAATETRHVRAEGCRAPAAARSTKTASVQSPPRITSRTRRTVGRASSGSTQSVILQREPVPRPPRRLHAQHARLAALPRQAEAGVAAEAALHRAAADPREEIPQPVRGQHLADARLLAREVPPVLREEAAHRHPGPPAAPPVPRTTRAVVTVCPAWRAACSPTW